MDGQCNMKIVDFGVAMQLTNNDDRMYDSQGTYHFMAPESCSSSNVKGYSGKIADIWALGVTLYSFIYFKVPFYDDNLLDLFNAIENQP